MKAQFFGGALEGSLDAQLTATSTYHLNLDYSHVDLAALAAVFPTLANCLAAPLRANSHWIQVAPRRADLVSSLECRGNARIADAKLQNISLLESMREAQRRPGVSSFPTASAVFSCGDGKIIFQRLRFTGAAQDVAASGWVDFSRNLNLQMRVIPAPNALNSSRAATAQMFDLTGPIRSPNFHPASPLAQRADEQENPEQRN